MELALDVALFKQDMRAHVHETRVKRDLASGLASGVQGIPTLFINAVRYDGDLKLAVTVPEPTTLALLALGVLVLPRRRHS